MATTIKREGKEKRSLSLPATLGKDAVPRAERSSSTDKVASSRSKRNPTPKNNTPTATVSSQVSGRPLARIKSPTAPQPSRNLAALDGVKKKALSPSSSPSTLRRVEEVTAGTSRRPNLGRVAVPAGTSPKPKTRGAAAMVAATLPRPKPGAAPPKPKAERAIKPQQKVPTSQARGRSPSKTTSKKDSICSSRSSPNPETMPEEQVIVPVVEMIPEDVVVMNADDEYDHQSLLDSTQLEDDQIPDLPDPQREKEPVDNAEEEADIKTEIGIDITIERNEEVEQPPKEVDKEEKEAEAVVVQTERTAAGRKQVKETLAYNDVIEETRSRLAERKSKVLALVGAFETVISLQEPETPVPVHAPAQANQQVDQATVAVDDTATSAAASDGDEAEQDDSADEPTSPPTLTTAAT